ncbi:multicopper oxidase [Catellatospora sp. TT07R-123]|uniref:multicopper oxidase family protein n=1 Tax=Catellatospora sp. TT07R-123 TaxID=2733863 RepID=UPI001B1DC3DA|nr:multicopper oxidase domain-containing protein [Catellatospora sp. TT07R-123]GHJ48255.1 multicopper oxidase [Catellatospora sp. TT07R-123]
MAVRRRLAYLAAVLTLLAGSGFAVDRWVWAPAMISTAGAGFDRPLPIPPLAPSHRDRHGRRVYDLRAQAGEHDFGAGPVRTEGFDGSYLGPTLRMARGEQVLVDVHDDLPEPTSVHWHGMRVPAAADGGPHQLIAPGSSWSASWRVDQPAATLWYHPHPHGATAQQVYRGLAGMIIVDDPATGSPALPHEYGVDDIPVIVQDKRFTADGRLDAANAPLAGIGLLGDTVAVNGVTGPFLPVVTRRVRLRLLNASNARTYDFGLTDGRRFALVGTDGGLLEAPVRLRRIMLSPGERAEIVVDLDPGRTEVLRSFPHPLGAGRLGDRFVGGDDTLDILQLRPAPVLRPGPDLPAVLAPLPLLTRDRAARTREFHLDDDAINGLPMDMDRVDARPIAGSTEIWRVVNDDGIPHNFHVHGVQFQVLTVAGAAPPPQLRGWKDTVFLPPGRPVELIMQFPRHPGPGVYMFHCHLLYHEDSGMMGQYAVIDPGS